MSPEFWLNLQTHYELALAERESLAAINREVLPCEQLEDAAGQVRMGAESIEQGKFSEYQGKTGLRKLAAEVKARGRSHVLADIRAAAAGKQKKPVRTAVEEMKAGIAASTRRKHRRG